jgi:hypothetical protein
LIHFLKTVYNRRLLAAAFGGMEARRMRRKWMFVVLWGILGTCLALSWSLGQERPEDRVPPLASRPPIPAAVKPVPSANTPKRDLSKLPLTVQQAYLSGQRGVDWLQRANQPDGRFVHGYVPALRSPKEGTDYLMQIDGAGALARAARFYGDDKAAAIARQALLTLLLDTAVDPKAADVRYTSMPSPLLNRVATAGMLVLAVHDLPSPGKDLLDQAAQLCNYLHLQQQADGSLRLWDTDMASQDAEQVAAIMHVTGPPLYALMRSQQQAPATWKIDMIRRACAVYTRWWREHKNTAMIAWHTAAYTEAYLATREPAFAEAVFDMNDWLCELQYQQLNPRQPLWVGGFKSWRDSKEAAEAPEVGSARYAHSLAHACRVARQAGDARRLERYSQAVEGCVRFLTTLQYTDANTQHFAEWYRPALVGAFHASHQDGDLRLDYTAGAVAAIVAYLDYVADLAR